MTAPMTLRDQDRKHLDNRRALAYLLDALLMAPMFALSFRYEWGVQALAVGLSLVYFFLCESSTGQTVGKAAFRLRVVGLDGQIAGPKAIAARTILRGIEEVLVGAIAIVTSGPKRVRIGDRVGKTLVVFALTAQGRMPGSYRYEVDKLCVEADNAIRPSRGRSSR